MSVYLLGEEEFAGYKVSYSNNRSPIEIDGNVGYSEKYREHCFAIKDTRLMVIATLTLSYNLVVKYKRTDNDFRLKGLQNELWKYAATVLGDIRHSANLTDLGRQSFKAAREASRARQINNDFVDYLYEETREILKYGVGNLNYNEIPSRIHDSLMLVNDNEYSREQLIECCEDLGIMVNNPNWNMVMTTILDKMLKEMCDIMQVDYYDDCKISEEAIELWETLVF